jgi:hypothetical protein
LAGREVWRRGIFVSMERFGFSDVFGLQWRILASVASFGFSDIFLLQWHLLVSVVPFLLQWHVICSSDVFFV